MSIVVENLTKQYGQQKAVDNVTFEVKQGEIVGFLGPNGAGKSTTLKIATTYITQTSGTVKIGNLDVQTQADEVRKIIGYLPESNPLYLDMYVHEYLQFIGGVHRIKKSKLKNQIKEVINSCGLEGEQNKLIGALSKGYRQRVGLAQSLIHEPKVLMLDEPTSGLDPNQIVEIRKLIKKVSYNKTVLFSTHIMQEVQALCDKAIIINKGKIVAYDEIEKLKLGQHEKTTIQVEFKDRVDIKLLSKISGVVEVEAMEEGIYLLHCDNDNRSEITKSILSDGLELVGLSMQQKSIEDVFQDFTKSE